MVRQAPARWLVIYCIIATAFLVGLIVAVRNRDRDSRERSERIEQTCALARENRDAVRALTTNTPLPTLGFPVADNLIVTYNEDIAARNARADKFLDRPLPDGCALP